MSSQERITQAIYRAVDELNKTFPKGVHLEKSPDAPLYGQASKLESIDLVNFIMEAEEQLNDEFGTSITVTEERALSQQNSPFRTLGTFTDYVSGLLKEHGINGD
ncbi:MAG: acyl carrier protein [Acidobacteria bacterium]|nr:acyl carrier protein [Acidobacteriota bacterium]